MESADSLIATIPPSWIIFLVAMIAALPRSSLPVRYTSGHNRCSIPAVHLTSGRRILILRSTVRTHREFLHAGPFPVIWKRIQDRKSGTAAGAVDKWVQITPVFRIVHFFLAFFADCNIRRDEDLPFCLLTFYDLKIIEFPVFFLFYIFWY